MKRLAIPGWDRRTPDDVDVLDFDEIVDRLAAQVERSEQPAVLVGFSAGALFAMALAGRHLWPLRGLLLLEPMGLPALELVGGDPTEAAMIRAAFEAYFAGVDAGNDDAIQPIWDVWNPPGSFAAVPSPVKSYLSMWGPLNVRDGRAALRASFDRSWFARIAPTTVVTYGTAGPDVWQHFAQAVADLVPNATVQPVAGATHTILETHASEVAALIDALLT